jgi:hypothetical protein
MTDQQIRLYFGELNAAEMRLARAIVGWHEAREAKLRAAANGLAEALERLMQAKKGGMQPANALISAMNESTRAIAAYEAHKKGNTP